MRVRDIVAGRAYCDDKRDQPVVVLTTKAMFHEVLAWTHNDLRPLMPSESMIFRPGGKQTSVSGLLVVKRKPALLPLDGPQVEKAAAAVDLVSLISGDRSKIEAEGLNLHFYRPSNICYEWADYLVQQHFARIRNR